MATQMPHGPTRYQFAGNFLATSSVPPVSTPGELRRRLGVADAVVIGAGSMIGAGVFTAWAPAADAAGTGLLIGLVLAGAVALCNATSSAQLAAVYPESGGTYVYGRERLGPAWGHLAGWGFVVGKTASCAAMALAVGAYVWPEQERAIAIAAVALIAIVNLGGLERTVLVTRALLAVSTLALAAVIVAAWSSDEAEIGRITPIDTDPLDVLRAAGFLFFAFAGYARIATLGEEVRDPDTTIPKAVPRALLLVVGIYLVVGVTAVVVAPTASLAATDAPLRLVVELSGRDAVAPVVRVGAAVASLGVLLNLVPGVSRTTLAMARPTRAPRLVRACGRPSEPPGAGRADRHGRRRPAGYGARTAFGDRRVGHRGVDVLCDHQRGCVHAATRPTNLAPLGHRVRVPRMLDTRARAPLA